MHDKGFRRWVTLGVVASASWLVTACGALPRSGGDYEVQPGFVRNPASEGYNGTIQQLHSSIDPRTPQTDGTPGRSLPVDLGEKSLFQQQGRGGSGSMYREGSAEYGLTSPHQRPAALSVPGEAVSPAELTPTPPKLQGQRR